jgi:hypothetical protein
VTSARRATGEGPSSPAAHRAATTPRPSFNLTPRGADRRQWRDPPNCPTKPANRHVSAFAAELRTDHEKYVTHLS